MVGILTAQSYSEIMVNIAIILECLRGKFTINVTIKLMTCISTVPQSTMNHEYSYNRNTCFDVVSTITANLSSWNFYEFSVSIVPVYSPPYNIFMSQKNSGEQYTGKDCSEINGKCAYHRNIFLGKYSDF